MPSLSRVSLREQKKENRYVLHLLHANTLWRGGASSKLPAEFEQDNIRGSWGVEVIDELLPLRDVEVTLRLPEGVKRATIEPQGQEIKLEKKGADVIVRLPEFTCHQMVVLHK